MWDVEAFRWATEFNAGAIPEGELFLYEEGFRELTKRNMGEPTRTRKTIQI